MLKWDLVIPITSYWGSCLKMRGYGLQTLERSPFVSECQGKLYWPLYRTVKVLTGVCALCKDRRAEVTLSRVSDYGSRVQASGDGKEKPSNNRFINRVLKDEQEFKGWKRTFQKVEEGTENNHQGWEVYILSRAGMCTAFILSERAQTCARSLGRWACPFPEGAASKQRNLSLFREES